MIVLPESWRRAWIDHDPFDYLLALDGEVYRDMDGRRTFRFELHGTGYFAKTYRGLGWWRIVRCLVTFRRPPVLSARGERLAIGRLQAAGVPTMTLAAWGERGRDPARRQSFIVTEELTPTVSLEDFCRPWQETPPDPALKRALTVRLADMVRRLHGNGLHHQDLYLCHFLLDTAGNPAETAADPTVYLIDLHRVTQYRRLPARARLKDLAALYFSTLEIGLDRRDYLRFIRHYTGMNLRAALTRHRGLWRQVEKRAQRLRERYRRKYAR
ncbi:MAG: lipopolysaccharide core heptose(I) kinase RfaP [Deltaproteobacteria bacterium]|nr:lipopolysaccharide core heptose(I) kinase RfaP [Candidatus Anaeroferrophillacea bacterium]